jgi:hypothetical protein
LSNQKLAQETSDAFSTSFDAYSETGMELQGDGSYRIDFKFELDSVPWDAQVFVEGRRGDLYMLLLATTEEAFQAGTYDDVIDRAISSYTVPKD